MNLNLFDDKEKINWINFPTELDQIIEKIKQINPLKYAKTRNFINGAVTHLSPYISRGVISSKFVLDQILQNSYDKKVVEKLLQELTWREYYQRIWQNKQSAIWTDLKQEQPNVFHKQMIKSVSTANTSIESIDLAIKNLYQTGYMHNHVRMYTASLVCNVGKAHWVMPSKWMYYHLLDGDIASNNCSWQWVCSAFSSKKYYFNQDNINTYTFSKQKGSYMDQSYESIMTMPIPDILAQTESFDAITVLPHTPYPILNVKLPTLIYNAYNLDPNWHLGENFNKILLLEPSHYKQFPVSDKVLNFIIDLSKNIQGLQIFCGEFDDLIQLYPNNFNVNIYFKEHPAFSHYTGVKEQREWMFPEVNKVYPSFFSYWNQCLKFI